MKDYLSLLPSTLQWISRLLGDVSPVPWPLWIGFLLPIYLGVITISVWLLRGTSWFVRCDYPKTQRGGPCRIFVPGEWWRCRYHNKDVKYAYGHRVKPELRRWETLTRNNKIVDAPSLGMGVFRVRPRGRALLYKNGYTRRPSDVLAIVPDWLREACARLKRVRLREVDLEPDELMAVNSVPVDTAAELHSVVLATRTTSISALLALILTAVAIPFAGLIQAILQWIATLAFVIAWASSYAGIYQARDDWIRGACLKGLRWWTIIFVPVAVANLFFAAINKVPS